MAIAPIDLQAVFTQVDKVGKTQVAQKEGQALAQAMQGVQIQKKNEEQVKQVSEPPSSGDGAEKIKDQKKEQDSKQGQKGSGKGQKDDPKESVSVLRDPNLGNRIDISL
jgi:hypothetical protein